MSGLSKLCVAVTSEPQMICNCTGRCLVPPYTCGGAPSKWGTLALMERQLGWRDLTTPVLSKPRIRVKAGSRWVPPGYKPPTQALREAYAAYREAFGE